MKRLALVILLFSAALSLFAQPITVPGGGVVDKSQFNTNQFIISGAMVNVVSGTSISNLNVYQQDLVGIPLQVIGFNDSTNVIQRWDIRPRPNGTPNVMAYITSNGVFYADGGFLSGASISSGVSDWWLTEPSTGSTFYFGNYGSKSNIVWLSPTNGPNGINSGLIGWTNAGFCASCGIDSGPVWTNQLYHVAIGSGITLDSATKTISSSGGYDTVYAVDYNPTSAGTTYSCLAGGTGGGATEASVKTYVTRSRTLTNFWVHRTEGSWTAGTNAIVTIRTNGVSTGLTVTLDTTTYVASNLTASATVIKGDYITVSFILNSAVTSTHFVWSLDEY